MSDGSGLALYNDFSGNSVFIANKSESNIIQPTVKTEHFSTPFLIELLGMSEQEANSHIQWLLGNGFIECV